MQVRLYLQVKYELFHYAKISILDQFDKYSLNQVDYLGQPYDYYSVMHYEPRTFSKNGQETIRPIASAREKGITLQHRNQFSEIDINELNIIANCPKGGKKQLLSVEFIVAK